MPGRAGLLLVYVERGVMLFIYSLGGGRYEGALRLGEHEVQADDSNRWV